MGSHEETKKMFNFSSVTDDRQARDTMQCNTPSCIPNGCIKPEQHYACDRQLAKVLMQYFTPEERKKVAMWLATLEKMTLDEDELSERSLYLTCLNILMQNGQLVPPFTRTPPRRPLKPLRDVIDRRLYKKVQTECRKRRIYEPVQYEQPDGTTQVPKEFYNEQPVPQSGIVCYGAAFSFID